MARIHSFDLARGFTVLLMPAVHTVMLYSNDSVQHSLLGYFLAFIAEGPGAQLFMLLMGIFFKPEGALQRAFQFFIAGYVLNLFKFVLPLLFGWLPGNLLTELQLSRNFSSAVSLFLTGDILQLAAISQLLLLFLYQYKQRTVLSIVFSIAIMLLGPCVWDMKTGYRFVDRVIGLFNGQPPQTFFPVFPWLVYPFAGAALSRMIKMMDVTVVIRKTGWFGFALMILSLWFPATAEGNFYRPAPADVIFHLGLVLAWLAIVQFINRKVRHNPFFNLLAFCSRHITLIYFIQWILIFWCIGLSGYHQLGMKESLLATSSSIILTVLLTKLTLYVQESVRSYRDRHRTV